MTLMLARKLKELGFSSFLSENTDFLCGRTVNQLELANALRVDAHQVAVMMSHPDTFSRNQTLYDIIRVAIEPCEFITALEFTGNEHIVQFIERTLDKVISEQTGEEQTLNFILQQLQMDSKYSGEAQGLVQILKGDTIALKRIAALLHNPQGQSLNPGPTMTMTTTMTMDQGEDMRKFLTELESVIKMALERRDPNSPNNPKLPLLTAIHFATIRLSLQQFQSIPNGPLALETIEFMAFLHPCEIPVKFISCLCSQRQGPEVKMEPEVEPEVEGQGILDSLNLLSKYSLVYASSSNQLTPHNSHSAMYVNSGELGNKLPDLLPGHLTSLSIYPIVQTYILEYHLPSQSSASAEKTCWRNVVLENLARRIKDVLSRIRIHLAEAESPRILMASWSLYEAFVKTQPYNGVLMEFEFELASVFLAAGQYSRALELYTHVNERHRINLGEAHVQTLEAELQMAIVLSHQDRFEEAYRLFQDVEDKFVLVLGDSHPRVLMARYQKAYIHFKRKELAEAEEILTNVWAQRKSILGDTHEDTMITECLFGLVWNSKGEQDRAREVWTGVLNKRTQIFGECHPATLRIKFNMAGVLTETEEDASAAEFYRRIAEGQMKTLGETHPETLNTLHDYAVTLGNQGRIDEAIACFKDIYSKKRTVLGENHPSTLKTQNYLQSLLSLQSVSIEV